MDTADREAIRVLHVDDEPGFAEMAGEFLEREDDRFRVTAATSVSAGLERLREDQFDCIVSDYDMPGQNGIEFLQSVRERHLDLPFVLFTGKGGEAVASEAISAGVTDYLQKTGDSSQYTVLANRVANAVDQHRSQRDLAASRRRLSQLIDKSPLGVLEWNQAFDVVRANDAAADIFGYSTDELEGGSWERLVPEAQRDDVANLFASLIEDEGGYHSINENVTADGDRILCEWHNRVVTDDAGEVVTIVSQVQDVTDRRRRERAIEELHDTAEAFATVDSPDAVANLVVQSAQEVLDMPITGVHFYDPVSDALVPSVYSDRATEIVDEKTVFERGSALCWEAYESGEPAIYDDVSSAENRYNPDTDVGSEMILPLGDHGVVLVGAAEPEAFDETDVSLAQTLATHAKTALDRLERETDLRETSARLGAVFEESPDMILVHDADGTILEVNRRLCEETGYEERDLLDMRAWEVSATVEADEAREMWAEMSVGDRRRVETEYRRADGSTFPVEVDVRRLDLEGKDRFVAIGRDVTERVRREEMLRELQRRTEELVRASDERAVAEQAVETARETLDMPLSTVHFVGEDGDELVPAAVTDEIREVFDETPTYSRTNPSRPVAETNWEVYETGESIVVNDTRESDVVDDETTPSRSGVVQPLGDHGVFITSSLEPDAFDESDVTLTEILATVTTAALDRAEREADLQQTSARLQAVFEGSPNMINVHDEAGNIVEVNQHLCEATGHEEETLLDMRVWDVDATVQPEAVREMWAEMSVGDRRRVETEYRRADGSTFPVEVDVRRLDLEGKDRFVVIGRDVTARVQREETLRDLQRRTEEMVRATDREEIAQIAVETARDTLELPLTAVHLVGEDGDELEPVAVTDQVVEHVGHPPSYSRTEPSRETEATNWEIFETGEVVVIGDTHDHDRFDAEATPTRSGIIHPLGDHGLFIVSSSEPDAFDDSDVALTEILATVTTAALDRAEREADLREQKRRLEAETERLDEFASIVSHDLRNPLEVAQGRLTFAERSYDDEEGHLAAVRRAQNRMESLIEDLLTLAREGGIVDDPRPVSLQEVVEGCWRNVDTGAASLVAETDCRVVADDDRLRQLLENLFRNAVEHGGEDVTVSVGHVENGFYVADDGPGIPESERESVFEAGYSTSEEGTGFGLSIVRKAVEAHGWDIRATAGEDGGARFEITGVEFAD